MVNKDLNYYLNLHWTYRFEWSDEDEGYVASVAELKGCKSFGETIEEATAMIKDALLSYIDCCLEHSDAIPEPIKPIDFKGHITYRTTPETHYKLAKKAAVMGKSINAFIDEAVSENLKYG
ncbi:protein HicB family [Candidatus Gastranaerophilus sp. (ex Termes propinquus)]|nr:protein HicB family [Candidatus Gastranaerophilus sp. (ex Termes propinquus)]